jgi:hypothetical protein
VRVWGAGKCTPAAPSAAVCCHALVAFSRKLATVSVLAPAEAGCHLEMRGNLSFHGT